MARSAKYSRLTSWILRLLVFVTVVLVISLGMISLMSGTGEPQREAMSTLLHDLTGNTVQVGRINALSYFPDIVMDVSDVRMTHPQLGRTLGELETARVVFRTWHVLFGLGRITELSVKNLYFVPDFPGARPLLIESAVIDPKGNGADGAALVLSGRYGDQPLKMAFGMEAGDGYYRVHGDQPFSASAGTLSITGKLGRDPETDGLRFSNLSIRTGEQEQATGSLVLILDRESVHGIADLTMTGGGSVKADLTLDPKTLSGTLDVAAPSLAGWLSLRGASLSLAESIGTLLDAPLPARTTLRPEVALTFTQDDATRLSATLGGDAGKMALSAVSGTWAGAAVTGSGEMVLATDTAPARLDVLLSGENAPLQALGLGLSGQAQMQAHLTGSGATLTDLYASTQTGLALAAAPADIVTPGTSGVPVSAAMTSPCLMAGLTLLDGRARADLLVLDTGSELLVGRGEIGLDAKAQPVSTLQFDRRPHVPFVPKGALPFSLPETHPCQTLIEP